MSKTYTQDEVDIQVLKTQMEGIGKSFDSIDRRFESIDRRLETIDATLKSQYSSTMNHFLGIYAMILTAIVAHIGGVF